MSAPWPSERPRTTRAGKAPRGQLVPTNWAGGLVVLFVIVMVTVVAVALWPFVSHAMDALQTLSDTLTNAARNLLA